MTIDIGIYLNMGLESVRVAIYLSKKLKVVFTVDRAVAETELNILLLPPHNNRKYY